MTGEAPVLSLDGRIVKNVFQQGRSERDSEVYGSKYGEDFSDARTKPGERCGSARRGWAGGIKAFLTIPPAN
jgi:hypothetical protein